MLIIEGPDNVGKTTLAKELLRRLWEEKRPYTYAHMGLLPPSWDFSWDYVSRMSRFIVQDRFHLGETVYGPLLCGRNRIDKDTMRWIDGYLRLKGALVVIVSSTATRIESNWDPLREAFTLDQVLRVNHRYQEIADGTYRVGASVDLHVHVHDSDPYPAENPHVIETILRRYCERQDTLDRLEGASRRFEAYGTRSCGDVPVQEARSGDDPDGQ